MNLKSAYMRMRMRWENIISIFFRLLKFQFKNVHSLFRLQMKCVCSVCIQFSTLCVSSSKFFVARWWCFYYSIKSPPTGIVLHVIRFRKSLLFIVKVKCFTGISRSVFIMSFEWRKCVLFFVWDRKKSAIKMI